MFLRLFTVKDEMRMITASCIIGLNDETGISYVETVTYSTSSIGSGLVKSVA